MAIIRALKRQLAVARRAWQGRPENVGRTLNR